MGNSYKMATQNVAHDGALTAVKMQNIILQQEMGQTFELNIW